MILVNEIRYSDESNVSKKGCLNIIVVTSYEIEERVFDLHCIVVDTLKAIFKE